MHTSKMAAAGWGVLAGLPIILLVAGGMAACSGLFGSTPNYVTPALISLLALPACALAGVLIGPRLRAGSQVPWKHGIQAGTLIFTLVLLSMVVLGWLSTQTIQPDTLMGIPVLLGLALCGPIPLLGSLWAALLARLGKAAH